MAKMSGVNTRGKAAAPETPATGMTAEQQAAIDKAGEETARMGRQDRILFWDRRQGVKVLDGAGKPVPGPDVIVCGHDKSHGPLIMHGGGSLLMCMASKNGTACTYNQPVSV